MNKTVNINLGGIFFHVDEDAYQKLNRYFDAIKRSLSDSSGQDEIMKDIEVRIAEIFSENRQSDKHVIVLKDVDDMIAIMGQPEDYRLEEEGTPAQEPYQYAAKKHKKLYRDIDNNILGGVAAGFGHYIGVDSLWIRLLLVIIVIAGFGSPILVYILLWILIPKALTTSEKLEMTGEPVNLSNIKKKAYEEFSNFSEKIENADYEKMGNQVKTGAEEIGTTIGKIFMAIFSVFAKFLGALIVITAISTLAGLFIGLFAGTIFGMPWQDYINAVIGTDLPVWVWGIITFFAIGIPFFFLLILGLKLLINNMKSIGNIAKYTLLALWIISVVLLISFGVKQATERAFDGKTTLKETISVTQNDTIDLKIKYNEAYANDINHYSDFSFVQNDEGLDMIYSNHIRIRIQHTNEPAPYMIIEKEAEGNSLSDAKKRAENIIYNMTIDNNQVILDNYFITDVKNRFRNQSVTIIINLPEGYHIKPGNSSIDRYSRTYYNDLSFHKGTDGKTYKVENKSLRCLNCSDNETIADEPAVTEDDDDISPIVRINKDGIFLNTSDKNSDTIKFKGLKINEDGIIIKSN